jgi:hypothetical protein
MHIKIDQNDSGKHEIFLMAGEQILCKSTEEDFPFFGQYSQYDTQRQALGATVKLAYLNQKVLTALVHEDDENDSLKSNFVRKYNKQIKFYMDMINRIEKVGDWKKKVDNLKKMVDGLKQTIDKTALMFENEGRPNPLPEDGVQQISVEQTLDPYAKSLLILKKKIHRFYKNLKMRFGDYSQGLPPATASTNIGDEEGMNEEFAKNVICELAESVTEELPEFTIEKIEKNSDGYDITLSNGEDRVSLDFSDTIMLRGVHPVGNTLKKYPHMSQIYYNDLWYPIVKSVGHFLFDENYVLVFQAPESDSEPVGRGENDYIKDTFTGFDVRDNSKISVYVHMQGEGSPISKSCNIKVASRGKQEAVDKSLQTIDQLRNVQMVKCVNTGTKYDDIAGKILSNEIVQRDGYFDVPVVFEFDNKHTEKVYIHSNNLVPYI